AQAPGVVASLNVTTGAASQVSVAVGAGNTGAAGQLIGEAATGQVIVGGVTSCTTTVWLHEAELPLQPVAVQVRVMLYVSAQAPGVVASLNVTTGAASQVSVAVGAGNTGAAGQLIGEAATGQVIVGGVTSCTTTVWLHEAELPLQSVAVQVRVML